MKTNVLIQVTYPLLIRVKVSQRSIKVIKGQIYWKIRLFELKIEILAPDERSCIDENECETGGVGLCKAREQCVNFYGGYRCDCDQGYARQGEKSTKTSFLLKNY